MLHQVASKYTKRVLILGHDSRMVLPILRSLGRRGIQCDLGWCPIESPARYSKFVRTIHNIPGPNDDKWIDSLRRVFEDNSYHLIIPACDPQVYLLQKNRDLFEDISTLYLLNEASFTIAFNKDKTYQLARSLSIPVPSSKLYTQGEQIQETLVEFSYPVILKPFCSVNESKVDEKNFVLSACSSAEAQDLLQQMPAGAVQIQEQVSGVGVGIEFLALNGNILAVHQHRRLHETTGHGSSYRKSVPVNSELYRAAAMIIEKLDYTGVGMCEFRVDEEKKQWWFIELNARFWGSLPLAVAAGVDFPWLLFQLLVEGRSKFDTSYKIGTRCRNIRSDLRWNLHWLQQRLNPEAVAVDEKDGMRVNDLSWRRNILDWLRLFSPFEEYDIFALNDPSPGFQELLQISRSCRKNKSVSPSVF